MEIEKTEFGFKATVPLITEQELKIINNNFDNMINKFLNMIIKDKDLATAQYIIKKQQEQINKLKRNSIPKQIIEDKIEYLNDIKGDNKQSILDKIKLLQELLKDN